MPNPDVHHPHPGNGLAVDVHMVEAFYALGYINPVAVGQCCAARTWSDGATSLARHAIVIDYTLANTVLLKSRVCKTHFIKTH